MKGNIAIIMPAYNEELTLRDTIEGFHRALPEAAIFVIDNNSGDGTSGIGRETLARLGCRGGVIFEGRQGKANAVRRAFHEVEADVYVMVDADMTYSPSDLPRLMGPVSRGEADMVVGDRQLGGDYARENKRPMHLFGNRLVRGLINLLFKSRLSDIMSGYRVMSRKFVKNYPILCEGFEIETEMTLHALDNRFRVLEMPTAYRDRPPGSASKLNTFKDGLRVLKTIFQIFKDYKPFAFFAGWAAFFFIAGVAVGFPVVMEYVRHKYVYKVPSAVLAAGCEIFALILFSNGLLLDTIARQHRFIYELKLLEMDKTSNRE